MTCVRVPLFLLCFLLLLTSAGLAQTVDSGYVVDIGDFAGQPGATVRMPVLTSHPIDIGAFLFRIVYPTTLLEPYILSLAQEGFTIYYDSLEVSGRGLHSIWIDSIDFKHGLSDDIYTRYNIIATHDAEDLLHYNALFIMFQPPIFIPELPGDENYFTDPYIDALVNDTTKILDVLFKVKTDAVVGATGICRVNDYSGSLPSDYRDNQMSNVEGTQSYRPELLRYGRFTVGDEPADPFNGDTCTYGYTPGDDTCWSQPVSNPPVITIIGPRSFILNQGESVPSVTVQATDPDGDDLTLQALSLPQGATFTPSNPVSGTGAVSGTFNWTPSFSQEGVFVVNFRAQDENGAIDVEYITITVEVIDMDRLYSTSSYGGHPVGGIPGTKPIVFPIDLVSTKTVYGIQYNMQYPDDVIKLDSFTVTSRTPDYLIYDNIGATPDTVKVLAFGLNNEPIGPVDTFDVTAIMKAYFTIDSGATPGDYWVHLYDAWESVDPNPEIASMALLTDSGVVQVDRLGDVNLDKRIDVADPVNVVGYIIGNYGLPPRNYATANVVVDTLVNVVDLVGIINLIFGYPIQPSGSQSSPYGEGEVATLSVAHGALEQGQLTKLMVKGEFPDAVAGVQLQIDYDPSVFTFDRPELAEAAGNFVMAYKDDRQGRLRMVLHSYQPWDEETLIPAGLQDIVRLPVGVKQNVAADDDSKLRLTQVYLSNGEAGDIPVEGGSSVLPTTFSLYQNYPNPFNPTTRIDFDISADVAGAQQVKLRVYNILGQQVKTLVDKEFPAGRHTVEWNGDNDQNRKVATGVYLYRLDVGENHQSKKMLLLK